MTFGEWWDEWSQVIWKAGGLASPNQVKVLFKNAYLEGYEAGHEAHKQENKCISNQPTAEHNE